MSTAALALAVLIAALGTSIANIALPALAEAFAAPFAAVQGVVVAYLAAMTAAVLVAGRIGDRYGLKPALIAGLGLFAAGSLLCALAPALPLLVAARVLQGVGAAFMTTLATALMRETAPEDRVGRAMGLAGTVSALGTALGPSLGGVLIPITGWRGVFWLQVPLAVLALGLAALGLPAAGARRTARAGRRWPSAPGLWRNLIANALVAAVMMATLVVGPFYLALGLGLDPARVGLVMAIGPTLSIVSGVPSGRLVDRWGSGRVVALGLVLLAAGAALLAVLPPRIGVTGYGLALLVLTPGYQLFQAGNTTATLAAGRPETRGTLSGLLGLARNLGLIAGASAMGAVFAFGVGTEDFGRAGAAAIGAGMRLTFLVASGLMLAAIAVARPGLSR
ncbi:MFS transporter [Prosthecomicrobium pneumaticum]|uniref:MFS family permease n=1 Tax=Prosthecomicrobium pneumaticum TaxID=81895 RepID=A0A7W9CTI0_9HYPH|nr:MFS transporter [Prosthecomicrobium pneumaticum]MBB5751628.1 MFS family permease [Prosthecomicrobium pneumaticum]